MSDLQSDVVVTGNKITGTLKYLDTGDIADYWGAGYFICLKFTDIDAHATSVKVGILPSRGSGLQELINDPDKNGVFKVSDKMSQQIAVITSDGTNSVSQYFDIKDLVLEA